MVKEKKAKYNQLSANIGLFYVAYELARHGWNVLITSRNAKGPDMIIYSQTGKLHHSIQVKSSGDNGGQVSAGAPESFLMSDFVIVIQDVYAPTKEHPMYIAKTTDLTLLGKTEKGGAYFNKIRWKDEETNRWQTSGTYGAYKDNFNLLGDPWDGDGTSPGFVKHEDYYDALQAWWNNLGDD